MSRRNGIDVKFDEASQGYYAVWEPIVIGSGKTRQEALQDLKEAAHFGADSFIDLKLENINKEKED
jgi:predicted RNase H-like HicB family nuclease